MIDRDQVINAGRKINWGRNTGLFCRLVLRTKQIITEMRMNFSHLCRMITPSVVALGEERDRIYRRIPQCLLPMISIELSTNPIYLRRCMKVQMNLAET